MPSLLCLGATDRCMNLLATKVANDHMRDSFKGVKPLIDSDKIPFWRSLAEALQPNILHFMYCGRNPDCTRLLNLTLSTSACWFLEFEITTTHTTKGIPCPGLVDASIQLSPSQRESGKVPYDLSRRGMGKLAVSFNPECDRLFVSRPASTATMDVAIGAQTCQASTLQQRQMRSVMPSSRTWNTTMKCGLFINKGQLQLFRWNAGREWCSSEMIFGDLPDEIVPAIFLLSCAGYASVNFVGLHPSPPATCMRCDPMKKTNQQWPCHYIED
eukprot:TRINITY_DN109628_c0_g1_i1.p1 TRINITY_DN109628_c0_g1~~TRINITY_DN109628_c0_g1_i1.p1  ORF type:complete len:310 (-),score=19.14 TRINITY_DN109628_c0_g1_i1:186-998(-)